MKTAIDSIDQTLEKKIISVKALDIDHKNRSVKVAISQLQDVDTDQDVFDPSSYNKTIKENGPTGTNEVWHLLDHTPKSFSALSKFSELGVDGKYVAGVSKYKNSFAWREVAWPLYEAGDITQHSVGFQVLDATERDSKGIRIIKQVRLFEGSAVLWGAQKDTPTMAIVKSLLNIDDDRDITAAEKIEEIMKKLKNHRYGYNDEDYSLFIIELKRLQTLFDAGQIKNIFEPDKTTQTTKQITEPNQTITLPNVDSKATDPMMTCPYCDHQMTMTDAIANNMVCDNCDRSMVKSSMPETVECPSCNKHTYNTQAEKGFVKCHRCSAMFNYGSKLFVKL